MKKIIRTVVFAFLCLSVSLVIYGNKFYVINGSDAGAGSLREAINNANSNLGADTIIFSIPVENAGYIDTSGIWSIQPLSSLPDLTDDSTFIDGSSQTANQGNTNPDGPEIEINGNNTIENGISVKSSFNTISHLILNRFTMNGIYVLDADENRIVGNYIGTDYSGTAAMGNYNGIHLQNEAAHNRIGTGNADDRNLVSGNLNGGILIDGDYSYGNRVQGNYIGTDIGGNVALGNRYAGIYVEFYCDSTIIGGSEPGEGNVISGTSDMVNAYTGHGISVRHTQNTLIKGNYIGTNKEGTSVLPNSNSGIALLECVNNSIGGPEPGDGNVIGGNLYSGIYIHLTETHDNFITGNYIGTDPARISELGNGIHGEYSAGILLDYGAYDNIMGPGNIIGNNDAYGIAVKSDSTTRNTITGNEIFNNSVLGIALIDDGNTGLDSPVIDHAADNLVSGTACPECTVEIFSTGNEEGDVFEGSVAADVSGNFSWTGEPEKNYVTATATDDSGNTSRFSLAVEYVTTGIVDDLEAYPASDIPAGMIIAEAYPNPFTSQITLHYGLPEKGSLKIKMQNAAGDEVFNQTEKNVSAGYHWFTWNGNNNNGIPLPSGLYYCTIEFKGIVKNIAINRIN